MVHMPRFYFYKFSLGLQHTTRRHLAKCGPVEGFVRSSKLFIIVYVQYNDNLPSF